MRRAGELLWLIVTDPSLHLLILAALLAWLAGLLE